MLSIQLKNYKIEHQSKPKEEKEYNKGKETI